MSLGVIGLGFILGLMVVWPVVLVSTSKWWHRRRHTDGLHIFSCDHCLKIWRERS